MSNFRFTRVDRFPPVVKNLIIINVLVFVAQAIFDQQFDLTNKLILRPVISNQLQQALVQLSGGEHIPQFQPYQVFTHMFAHAPLPMIYHILFNMFTLWMFGRILENVWGAKRFLLFYLACRIGAAALHLLVQYFR